MNEINTVSRALALLGLTVAILVLPAAEAAHAQSANRPALAGGLDDKPFLNEGETSIAIGGYIDMEFEYHDGGANTFDQHRFVPFIHSEVSDRVTVMAEIEFEHGGFVSGSKTTSGEIKLEYATLDFRVSDGLVYRGGVVLSPLGSFNLLHDSPLNDLTARPTVVSQLVPTTLSESGMGFHGTFFPGETALISYEAYVVNGFNEGIISGDPGEEKLRIRGGRGSQKADNNKDKALVARLGWSPKLGIDLGFSAHTGKYDDAGEHGLTIADLDARVTLGALELQGELAMASADVDRQRYPTVAESQRGAYGQANFHVLHDRVLPGSVFTLVGRYDWMDYDSDRAGDDEQGLTLGLNFRPTEKTAFKLDYNWTWATPPEGDRGDARGRLFFSFASYF